MARYGWALALIIISLPILATVITAFRIRDLPKSHDSYKLETKKTQPCENCDVKVGQKVQSVKIDSGKQKYEDSKKVVKDKQPLLNEKSSHKYEAKSDEDDDEDDDLEFSKIQIGFRHERPKDSKLSKSESDSKVKSDTRKLPVKVQNKDSLEEDEEDDDDEDDDDDDDYNKSEIKVALKSKIPDINKISSKPQLDSKRSDVKVTVKKPVTKISTDDDDDDDEDDNDDDDDDNDSSKSKKIFSSKVVETKKTLPEKNKSVIKSPQAKGEKVTKHTSENQEKNNSDDDDDDDDEADEDDDDDYKGLDNIDELFKILDMKPGSRLKKDDEKSPSKHHIEIQTQPSDKHKKPITAKADGDDNDDDDDDEDNDNDNEDKDKNIIVLEKKSSKSQVKFPASKISDKSNIKPKKGDEVKEEIKKSTTKQELFQKESKDKVSQPKEVNYETKKDDHSQRPKSTEDNKKTEPVKKEDKHVDKPQNDGKSTDKKKEEKEKSPKTSKKEEKKDAKDNKKADDKIKLDSAKKSKESEKETTETKNSEKEIKITSQEAKKPSADQKKDTSEHKDIFTSPERKKDIKYEFEKQNAHNDRHKADFDYSEFEKMQISKSHPKEKKKPKPIEIDSDSREEKYLKHVTDALNRRNLLKSEFDDFYAFFPTFAPNFSRIHNPECRRHGQILLRQLRGTKLWALNMLDATAKIPSGVLQGNGIQLGDFDQCLGSRARVQLDTGSVVKVQGKYCLARLELKAEHTELEAPVYLAQAKSLIRSRIDDPGHFVPRFSTLSWGVCVPAACDGEDVEVVVKDALKHYQHKSGLVIKVKVDEDDCHTDEEDGWDEWLELPVLLTLSLYGVVIMLVLVATVQDYIARREPEESQKETGEQESEQKEEADEREAKKRSDGILSPFSLYRSINKLIAPGTTDEISCIHGVRGIATLALLVAHKFMPVAVMPYTNRVKITEIASSPLWSWCRAGWVFTDCFLLLSGALASHRIASDSETGALKRLYSRYLRLTPALLAVVLFYAYIWDKLSTGPMWGTFVTKNAEICEKNWWWNLLYVQNYFGLEDMCAPQTHQLALDMQLTIFGGIIMWLMQSGLTGSQLILPTVHLIAAYFRYTTVRDHRLTLLAYHGVSVSQLYRTARLSYTSTLHRCSPYLIGISLGLGLKKPARHGKFLLTLGWVTSLGLAALVAWSGIDSGSTQYRYNANFAALYAAIAPLASAMAIAWVIYVVHSGTCDFLSRALCWRPLVFISRLSYALYLCQFIIFLTSAGTIRTSREFTLMSLIDLQEIAAILLLSTILTITFIIPMQSLHKIFTFQLKSDSEEPPEKEKDETEPNTEEKKEEPIEEKKDKTPPARSRHNLVAHREMLEEIPEMEVEYETQREIVTEGLDEIIEEEEEGTVGEEEDQIDDLEIIEEEEAEEAGEEDWLDRDGERSYSRQDDRELDEWEWTANGRGRSGAQYYRYAR